MLGRPHRGARVRARVLLALATAPCLLACEDEPLDETRVPIAVLDLPQDAQTDVPVRLDASRSREPRGLPLTYVFRITDGSLPIETASAVTYHVFSTPGRHQVCVEVVAVGGGSAQRCGRLPVVPFAHVGLEPTSSPTDAGPADAVIPWDAVEDQRPPDRPQPPDLARFDAGKDRSPPDLPVPDLLPPDQMVVDQMPVDQMPVDQMPVDQMPVDQMPVDRMPVDRMPVDQMPVDQGDLDGGLCFGTEVGGTGTAGYVAKSIPACHVEILPTAASLGIDADDQGTLTIIPFDFWFYGKSQFAVGVSSNGYLQFPAGGILQLSVSQPAPLPSSVTPNNLVAAFWDDLAPAGSFTDVYAATIGAAPHRVHVIQWHRWSFAGTSGAAEITFSVYLYETSNAVELQYLQLVGGDRATGSNAAVGIEDAAGATGIQHVYKQAGGLSTAAGIRFVPR